MPVITLQSQLDCHIDIDIRATKRVVLQVCLYKLLGESSSGYYVKCPSMSTATLRHVALHPYSSGPHGAYKAFGSMTSVEKKPHRDIFKIHNDAIESFDKWRAHRSSSTGCAA